MCKPRPLNLLQMSS